MELARPRAVDRFTIELIRVLAARTGLSEREWRKRVRVAYAKVAEFQARGLVHFHAIIRLDGAEDRATAPGVDISSEELCAAIRKAAASARLGGDAGDGQSIDVRFGEQLHTGYICSASAGTSSPSPAATPPPSASYAPPAPPTAPAKTNRPTTLRSTTIRAGREALLDLRRAPPST